ncbi:MAG: hypothetical protein IPJ28_03070 [Betaproteobacteria bacterium]|nr:hypothetical protein [Betaproteobacteria bacterium]
MKRLLAAFLLVLPFAAAAGPYDQPWSIVTTDTRPSSDPNLRPVIVNRVDGETVMSRTPAVIAPGRHQVTVDLPPRKGFKVATQETFELLASPCMRYYVAAKLDTSVGQEWKAVIRSSELIGECASKFKTGKPAS